MSAPCVSSAAYYGHHAAPVVCEESMECTEFETESPQRSRKRAAAYAFAVAAKRRRRQEVREPTPAERRPTDNFVRTTHNNPDISRCLMAYMI